MNSQDTNELIKKIERLESELATIRNQSPVAWLIDDPSVFSEDGNTEPFLAWHDCGSKLAKPLYLAAPVADRFVNEYGMEIKEVDLISFLEMANKNPSVQGTPIYYAVYPIKAAPKGMKEGYVGVAKIIRNSAGQISTQNMEGDYFDISKYAGEALYIKAAPK